MEQPKMWRDMTPEEKGALLLAKHEKRRIQQYHSSSAGLPGGWFYRADPDFLPNGVYRVEPEPVRETVRLYGPPRYGFAEDRCGSDTHYIEYDLIDGQPDCASVRMGNL